MDVKKKIDGPTPMMKVRPPYDWFGWAGLFGLFGSRDQTSEVGGQKSDVGSRSLAASPISDLCFLTSGKRWLGLFGHRSLFGLLSSHGLLSYPVPLVYFLVSSIRFVWFVWLIWSSWFVSFV